MQKKQIEEDFLKALIEHNFKNYPVKIERPECSDNERGKANQSRSLENKQKASRFLGKFPNNFYSAC